MLDGPFARRLVTIPIVYISLAVLTVLLPFVVPLALVVDLIRYLLGRTPAMAVRIAVFGWFYLLGEAWAIAALAFLGLLPDKRSLAATYRAQRAWLDWNFEALRLCFDLHFRDEGADQVAPGPILLLSRHASMIDTMLPGRYVVKPHGIKLRYVLKKELLIDPALDIGGNRMPNYFLDRSGDARAELAALRDLASSLAEDEGVLIYPEGTRYSDAKRNRYVERWKRRGGRLGDIASGFRRVLPPRPAGTLALLESTAADIVVLAHRGLEGFARVKDLWTGGLVGSTIDIKFWRVPRVDVPEDKESRMEWLFNLWAEVDQWVVTPEAARG